MAEYPLFSLDRIEGDSAVLIADDGTVLAVPMSLLPSAETGKMYRKVGENFIEDSAAEQARRARIQALQNRLRSRKN